MWTMSFFTRVVIIYVATVVRAFCQCIFEYIAYLELADRKLFYIEKTNVIGQLGRKHIFSSNMISGQISGQKQQNPNEHCWFAFICINNVIIREFKVYQGNLILRVKLENSKLN